MKLTLKLEHNGKTYFKGVDLGYPTETNLDVVIDEESRKLRGENLAYECKKKMEMLTQQLIRTAEKL